MKPTVRLAIFIEDGRETGQREFLEAELRRLPARSWSIGEPQFAWAELDDDTHELPEDDEPPGGVFILLPDAAGASPEEDRRAFEDAKALIDWAAAIATRDDLYLSVEYAEEVIGEIGPAGPDRGVAEGLLGEWARHLPAPP